MTDVNEEIVKAYYEAQGYIVKTNHYYAKRINPENIVCYETGEQAESDNRILVEC